VPVPEDPAKLDETLDAKPYEPPKQARSLTAFYVVVGILVALGLFGTWFWRAYTVWWFDADEAKRRQVAAAAKLGVPVEKSIDLGGGVFLDLVLIPAGRFKMGHPNYGNMMPHTIAHPFYMGKYEVTQEQWKKVMGTNYSTFEGARNPVESVTWKDIESFLKRLDSFGKGMGQVRLPTEAEWEWACRAGTKTEFCMGDGDAGLEGYAWYESNSGFTTHPVGTRKPNAWSLYDMYGNVAELCTDSYGAHSSRSAAAEPRTDPTNLATGSCRVLRGGTWDSRSGSCLSFCSIKAPPPDAGDYEVGFRVVLVPAKP
jgi:formylglycine-generating enzyme required for sulfatase activity